jgi:hypothetical protein
VNEEGTEAAAVTEVAVYRWYNLCFPSDNDVRKPAKFIANHPTRKCPSPAFKPNLYK